MPGLKHQSIVQILRDDPQLLVMFLGRSGFRLPSGAFPVIADSDLSHRGPRLLKELRSDNVFVFQGLLVIAAGRRALTGSEHEIEIGQPGFNLRPFVSGRDRMPPPGGPFFGPELTMLHVLAGTLDLSIHEARVFAFASIAEARPERYRRYVHLIRILTPRNARQELEQLMEDFFKDPFIDRFIEQGKELGKELGRAEGAAHVLLAVLTARGLAIPKQVRARISECTDPDLLDQWATRAATSTTIDEVFAS